MNKHTPGPWAVADLPHSIVVRTESPKKSKFGASRYAAIGGFDRSDPEQLAEAMANARLIAAAPDLLEALEFVIRGVPDTWEGAQKARAAIAKATGGEG